MFAGPTTTRPAGHLVVFSLRDVPDELKAVATLLALDTVWRQVSDPAARRRRLVVVDEAWLLMRNPEGAKFLFRMAKAARKHWAGLAVVTQDAEDVLGSDLGRAVIATPPPRCCSARPPRPSTPSPTRSGCRKGRRRCCWPRDAARACWPAGRPPGCPSRPSPPPPSTFCAPATRPSWPPWKPPGIPGPGRTRAAGR